MKKILFLFLMCFGLMGSLYALDTGQTVGCDIEGVVIAPAEITYVSLEHEYDRTQAILVTQKIGPKHYALILRQEVIATVLDNVDICIINGGYSNYMGESGV